MPALLLGVILLWACAEIPRVTSVNPLETSSIVSFCEDAFPSGTWQFSHAVTAILSNGFEMQLMGVTQIASARKRIHAVMMTIEGLVLFDGVKAGGKLTINRSVAPFDKRTFAHGLMEDIQLMFLKPDGKPENVGISEDGFGVCRYKTAPDDIVDVTMRPRGRVEIRKYHNNRLIRKVFAEKKPVAASPNITLIAYGTADYELNLRLIGAEQLEN